VEPLKLRKNRLDGRDRKLVRWRAERVSERRFAEEKAAYRIGAVGEGPEVVPAFQGGHEPTAAQVFGKGPGGVKQGHIAICDRNAQHGQGVAPKGIESKRDEDHLRPEAPHDWLHDTRENGGKHLVT
jgi:hypothetical protein